MALIYKTGDILDSKENVICHQCNLKAIFNEGLSVQLKKKYPNVENDTRIFVNMLNHIKEPLIGKYNTYHHTKNIPERIEEVRMIANIFSQNADFTTNYKALESALDRLLKFCKDRKYTVAISAQYSFENSDWGKVESIFKKVSNRHKIDVTIYRRECD